MVAPTDHQGHDELEILREYTCGCIVYRRYDSSSSRWLESDERGMFCDDTMELEHKRALVFGRETQPDLFHVPAGARRLEKLS